MTSITCIAPKRQAPPRRTEYRRDTDIDNPAQLAARILAVKFGLSLSLAVTIAALAGIGGRR